MCHGIAHMSLAFAHVNEQSMRLLFRDMLRKNRQLSFQLLIAHGGS